MIKFFRKIRQNLLTEGKTKLYFKYAIGEIILVVIGILIALQINNWNEHRKQKIEEVKMLQNFRTIINTDNKHVSDYSNVFDETDKSIYTILEYMENDLPYNDSLNKHFRQTTALWSIKIDQEYFSTLTSSDLNIISNDSLKKELISYYSFAKRTFDVRISRYANIIEDASKNIFNTRFNELWGSTWDDPHYEDDRSIKMTKPLNYESLKKDVEYLYFLKSLKNQLFWYVRAVLYEAKARSEKIIKILDEELK